MIPESTRCTVDMLSQILNDKTIDVGKKCEILIKDNLLNYYMNWAVNLLQTLAMMIRTK